MAIARISLWEIVCLNGGPMTIKSHGRIGFSALFILSLAFSACTQGQGPGQPDKVTVAGTEGAPAPTPVDVCEKPENLDNILCQWVATKMSYPDSSAKKEQADLFYDSEGRLIRIDVKEGDKAGMLALFTYNEFGLWKVDLYSEADPATGNFTKQQTRTTTYNLQTKEIKDVIDETRKNGTLQTIEEHIYASSPLGILTVKKDVSVDPTMNPIGVEIKYITKDSNTNQITQISEYDALPQMGAPPLMWKVTDYSYNAQGRLEKTEEKTQDCQITPCSAYPNPVNTPHAIDTSEFEFDSQNRLLQNTQTSQGAFDFQTHAILTPVTDPVDPSKIQVCDATYEIQTEAKIAGKHPIDYLIGGFETTGFGNLFGDRDIFTTFGCHASNQPMNPDNTAQVKWVRLWEALPEGKPPGS